jgi:hypothetical protein
MASEFSKRCPPVALGQGGTGFGIVWGSETAEAMPHEADFDDVRRNVLPQDPMNVWFGARHGTQAPCRQSRINSSGVGCQ